MVVESKSRARRDTKRTAGWSPLPKPSCWRWNTVSARAGSKTPPKSGEPPNESSAPAGSDGCSTSRSDQPIRFVYHYNQDNQAYEKLLAGRYVLTPASHPHRPTPPKSWPATANCKQSKPSSEYSKTSYDYGRCDTGPKNESAVTWRSACTPPYWRPLINHALATADIRDPDLEHQHLTAARALQQLNAASAACNCPPTTTESRSPPDAPPYKPEPSPPSEPTPAPGTKPPSPNPHGQIEDSTAKCSGNTPPARTPRPGKTQNTPPNSGHRADHKGGGSLLARGRYAIRRYCDLGASSHQSQFQSASLQPTTICS